MSAIAPLEARLTVVLLVPHATVVLIGAPMLITGELGPLRNFNHFFMCGVPGGADYVMLFAV